MKLNKIILSAGIMAMGCLSAFAQAPEEPQAKTVYDFNPHWYIQLQGGAQYTLGEISFKKLVSPNVQLAGGYEFNPVLGLRLSVNAWQSKGGSEYLGDVYKWKWNYVAPMLDLKVNLTNAFLGYKYNRVVNFSALLGVGANIAWHNDDAAEAYADMYVASALTYPNALNIYDSPLEYLWDGTAVRFVARAGFALDFRLNDNWSLGLEATANGLIDRYNSKKAGNPDWYFNALAGVRYNFGKTYNERVIPAPKPAERIIERIIEKPAPAPAPAPVVKAEPIRRDIFFKINSSEIRPTEAYKVEEIARFLKSNKDAKADITGYADAGTGTAAINNRLSAARAKAVVDALVNQYGIDASRINENSKGSTVQPFADNDSNRVTICLAE